MILDIFPDEFKELDEYLAGNEEMGRVDFREISNKQADMIEDAVKLIQINNPDVEISIIRTPGKKTSLFTLNLYKDILETPEELLEGEMERLGNHALYILRLGIERKNKTIIKAAYDMIQDEPRFYWDNYPRYYDQWDELVEEANEIML